MKYHRCKCGKHESWESGMPPTRCSGCAECQTTLEMHPEDHTYPEPHDWRPRYNPLTGEREADVCNNCMARRGSVPEWDNKPDVAALGEKS